jgi:hypothetical protein
VADTAGHTFIVGKEWTEVPERFRRQIVAEGGVIEGMEHASAPDPGVHAINQDEITLAVIRDMVDEGKADEFGNDGKPKLEAISKRAGFNVTRHMRDKAWMVIAA